MTDEGHVAEIERFDDRRKVVRVAVHVVAG
jgi:hypothetical protein